MADSLVARCSDRLCKGKAMNGCVTDMAKMDRATMCSVRTCIVIEDNQYKERCNGR